MAVKCNITTIVLEQLNEVLWGVKCKDNSIAIVENYIEYLNCPEVNLIPCHDEVDDCSGLGTGNNPIINNCNMNIVGMSFSLDIVEGIVTFYLGAGDIYGAAGEISYLWSYDENVFDLIGEVTDPTIILKVKPGKDVEYLVTPIRVDVYDENECSDFKQCYYTPDGMQCADDFVPCSTPNNLIVTPIIFECSRPSNLTVTNI